MDRQEDNDLIRHLEPVQSAWIDYNGHMNVAYYVLAFDHATDVVLDALGLGAAYADTSGMSIFVADMHVAYRREVHEGDMLRFESRLFDFDDKRLHIFHTMLGGKSMEVAATTRSCVSTWTWAAAGLLRCLRRGERP